MDKLPDTIPLTTVHDALTVLGLDPTKVQRVSLLPDAVVVDHLLDTEVGRVPVTTSIGVTW